MPIQNLKLVEEGRPSWCHNHSRKMSLVAVGLCNDFLVLQGSAAELIIQRERRHWKVRWCVLQSGIEHIKGTVFFSDDSLRCAFGLSNQVPDFGKDVLEKYGGTTAHAGQFIRYENWLNIPCPGTGHDGDPNISIRLDEKMREAVQDLLVRSR